MHFSSLCSVGLATNLITTVISDPYVFDPLKKVTYQGFTASPGIESFLGIPYGQDTSGQNRFAPPQAFVPSTNYTFNATAAGPSCPQPSFAGFSWQSQIDYQSEDCLNLNVVRPARNASCYEKLPVMVYIYGGSLFSGTANERTTQPNGLVQQSVENGLPIIAVEMNYRLNIFGFATSEALRGNKSLNVGLKDQRLALEWVQKNIKLFGGDPDKVTIFGQSSGGLSVGMQTLAYGGSKPAPFQAAIMESTALEPGATTNISFNSTTAVAQLAGCNVTDSQSSSVITCLRALSMESLLNYTIIQQDETSSADGDIYLPTVDQDFLPMAASELVARGKFPKMPLIVGWQENDATLFTAASIKTANDTRAFFDTYYSFVNSSTLTKLLDLYPVSEFTANPSANLSAEFYRSAEIFRDILFVCPGFLFESAMAKKYINETSEPPVYLYSGNQTLYSSYLAAVDMPGRGVVHTSEFPYIFADILLINVTQLNLPGYTFDPTESDYALVERWSRSWSTFASTLWSPSLEGKNTLQGWTSAFPGATGEGELFVVGGGNEGMSGVGTNASNENIRWQRLGERCGFLNSPEVVKELHY